MKKRIKRSVVKPETQDPANNAAKSKPAANQPPWQDEFTEITDTPDGLRTLRCLQATFYIHKTEAFAGIVMPEEDQWWWCCAGADENQGYASLRAEAEQSLLECLSAMGSGV